MQQVTRYTHQYEKAAATPITKEAHPELVWDSWNSSYDSKTRATVSGEYVQQC